MILITLLSLCALGSSQLQKRSVCVKLESVYDTICPSQVGRANLQSLQGPPGKLGPSGRAGQKGSRGNKGEKGTAGEANYDRVEDMISQRIQEVLDKLAETNEIIMNLVNKTGLCELIHQGKCFWFKFRSNKITFNEGQEICSAAGARPANIYSEGHYNLVLEHLRQFSQLGPVRVWLGMTNNPRTDTVLLTNGAAAPFVKWRPGFPDGGHKIYLRASTEPDRYLHLATTSPSYRIEGVICEI